MRQQVKDLGVKLKVSKILATLGLLLFCFVPFSQASIFDAFGPAKDGPLDVDSAFIMTTDATSGGLTLNWQMPDDYYLYRDKVALTLPENVRLVDRAFSKAELKSDPLFGDVFVYYQAAQADFTLVSEDNAEPLVISVTYQGCWDGGICYPPVTKDITLDAGFFNGSMDRLAAMAGSLAVAKATQSEGSASRIAPQNEQSYFSQVLKGKSLAVVLGLFFVAGVALSFTPCVFPMLPILSSIIAGQGEVKLAKSMMLTATYVLSVAVAYTLLGVAAGLLGANLQAMFQTPWLIISFSLVFVALALSMFGFYELQLPAGLQSKLANMSGSQQGGQITGVAIMGVLSALIVGPCMAAPLAGALLYISETGDPVLGGFALFSLSLGMGVPLLVLGASAGSILPRAGAWMNGVKAVFGVALLLMAVWMLSRVIAFEVTTLLVVLILMVSSIWGLFFTPHHHPVLKLLKGVCAILLVYTLALFAGLLAGSPNLLQPLKVFMANGQGGGVAPSQDLVFEEVVSPSELEAVLAKAKAEGKPAMLDFYADWCISCVELEQVTFKDEAAKAALSPLTLIRVDVTEHDEAAKALYKKYQVMGPPALIFVNAEGKERKDMMLVGVLSAPELVEHLKYLN